MVTKAAEATKKFINEPLLEVFKKGRVVVLTGAGISAESGIPTFRGENGLWLRYDPDLFASAQGLLSVLNRRPQKLVEFLDDLYSTLFRAQPNPAHFALAEMEKIKVLNCVITQNIDNLHQDAGSNRVWELHGNAFNVRCDGCGVRRVLNKEDLRQNIEQMKNNRESRRTILESLSKFFPHCSCGSRFRIDVVLFGELLPAGILENAFREIENCSLLILIGTSGSVYPAASLPIYAKNRGVKILEINNAESDLSVISDYQLTGKAGEILPELIKEINQ